MKKKCLIILVMIACLFDAFRLSQKATSKNIPSSEMNNLLINKDKIVRSVPHMPNVYNFTYHIDNKKRIVYIIPDDVYKLKGEMDNLRTTPVGASNLSDQTRSEKSLHCYPLKSLKSMVKPGKFKY